MCVCERERELYYVANVVMFDIQHIPSPPPPIPNLFIVVLLVIN